MAISTLWFRIHVLLFPRTRRGQVWLHAMWCSPPMVPVSSSTLFRFGTTYFAWRHPELRINMTTHPNNQGWHLDLGSRGGGLYAS